jgi:hypothetical protein
MAKHLMMDGGRDEIVASIIAGLPGSEAYLEDDLTAYRVWQLTPDRLTIPAALRQYKGVIFEWPPGIDVPAVALFDRQSEFDTMYARIVSCSKRAE